MFSLNVLPTPPPRPRLAPPLRPLAWALRRLAVAVAVIAVWQRVMLRRIYGVRWTLDGRCASCGRCCENLLLDASKKRNWLRVFWHEQVFDFYPKENEIEGLRAYGCRNFTVDRKCSRYALRPFVCRIYPALPLYLRPQPKPHCGFKVIDD